MIGRKYNNKIIQTKYKFILNTLISQPYSFLSAQPAPIFTF